MRAHHAEHSNALPVMDVAAMRHVAYVFDALIYYMRAGRSNTFTHAMVLSIVERKSDRAAARCVSLLILTDAPMCNQSP